MNELKKTALAMIRQHPRWPIDWVASELLRQEGKRPTIPMLREWMQEARKEVKR